MAKHFWKTVIIFIIMIVIGLIGVVIVSNLDEEDKSSNMLNNKVEVAK